MRALAPRLMFAPCLIGANISSDANRPNDDTPQEGVYYRGVYLVRVGEVGIGGIGRVEL